MKRNRKLKKKKNNPSQRFDVTSLSLSLILVSAFVCLGGYMAFVVYPSQSKEMKRFADIPWLTFEQFKAVSMNGESLIQGNLSDNDIVGRDNLVAYVIQRWDVTVDHEEEENDGRWRTISEKWPGLNVTIPLGKVRTTSGAPPRLMGQVHEYITVKNQGPAADYDGEPLPHGSERIIGFKNQDLVTVVGEKTAGNMIKPEYFHSGSRDHFLNSLRTSARIMQVVGFVFMFIGLVVGKVIFFTKD